MRKISFMCVALATLSACGAQNSVTDATYTANNTASNSITREKIASCWRSVGLPGDIYKFMTPEEAAGIKKIGGASQAQLGAFKSCLAR